jgi:HD-GYP domain-containing protein (c-di-GMP phosphodiesterase class II)
MIGDTLNSVNEHCLDNIMKLAETTEVIASEAIYDTHGTKLWAQGARITPALKERLIRHKLRKPLETSLSVADVVTTATILAEARRLQEEVPALKVVFGDKQDVIFAVLSRISLHPVAALLQTVADKSITGALRHGALVALLAVALGVHGKLTGNDLAMLALTGLLHDIGLLYVQPDFLNEERSLKPDEWKHMAVHPLIGQIVLGDLANYPKIVTDAIAAHHERVDGSGYPRNLSGQQISTIAQTLAMAEMLSGIFTSKEDVLTRACLAIKWVPGEHSRDLVSVFSTLRRNYAGAPLPEGTITSQAATKPYQVTKTLVHALAECERIAQTSPLSPALADLLNHVKSRLDGLRHALKAAGIEECIVDGHMTTFTQDDHQLFLEIEVVGEEMGWRERDIARDLYLRLGNQSTASAAIFNDLISILDKSADA